MIIYATTYDPQSGEITGESVDSGFVSIDNVVVNQPGVACNATSRLVTYKPTDDRHIVFSDFPFYFKD